MHKIFFIILAGLFLIASCAKPDAPEDDIITPTGDTLTTGIFSDAPQHDCSGNAAVIKENDVRSLVFYNFETDNGPDLRVYLSRSQQVSDGFILSELQTNVGNNVYPLNDSIDHLVYNNVIIWCERFGVLFGTATLTE